MRSDLLYRHLLYELNKKNNEHIFSHTPFPNTFFWDVNSDIKGCFIADGVYNYVSISFGLTIMPAIELLIGAKKNIGAPVPRGDPVLFGISPVAIMRSPHWCGSERDIGETCPEQSVLASAADIIDYIDSTILNYSKIKTPTEAIIYSCDQGEVNVATFDSFYCAACMFGNNDIERSALDISSSLNISIEAPFYNWIKKHANKPSK